jgi:diguanylate cyclase (GGDEF)-like protein/putative nucleotidyltransferase with HDIG domain
MKNLSLTAKIYILSTIFIGAGLIAWQFTQLEWQANWLSLLLLAAFASVTQIYKVEGSTHKSSYNISWLVYGFTFLLLGTPAVVFIILVSHMVEWVRHKYPWYIQSFNIGSFAIAISAAGLVYTKINPETNANLVVEAVAVLSALAVFTLINHFMIGMVIKLARGQSFKQSGVFGLMTLMIDYAMIGAGVGAALIWSVNPFALPLSLLPLYLIYNTLHLPALQRKTEIDPKTGLFNAKYFTKHLEDELARADRFDRPLTLVMGDLDLLRNINNTYGHLAGDVVLIGVAELLQEFARDYDIVSRFGGEEFAILMPETSPDEVYPLIERMRCAIQDTDFEISTSVTPIKATISFGVTGRDGLGQTTSDLIHKADVALYHSKIKGRNTTSINTNSTNLPLDEVWAEFPVELEQDALAARVERTLTRFRPNPLREPKPVKEEKQTEVEDEKIKSRRKLKPAWLIKAYIGFIFVTASALFTLVFSAWHFPIDWLALAILGLILVVTETFSIEVYVKKTSISTSGIILLAGVFLFGPMAGLFLSLILAITAKLVNRSEMIRMVFNASNHLLYSSIIAVILLLNGGPIVMTPVANNLALSVLLASLAFLFNTYLVAGAIGITKDMPTRDIWVTEFRWLIPYYLAYGVVAYGMILSYFSIGIPGILIVLIPIFMLRISQVQYIDHTKEVVTELRTKNTKLERQAAEITQFDEELLLTMASIVDMRDPNTFGHSRQVAKYAVRIAKQLGLAQDDIELIHKGGLLHDIGKLGIPDRILFKPGRLTADEFDIIKQHPIFSEQIVGNAHCMNNLKPILRHHHERYDGRGYPDGLQKDEIPLEARIMALSDAVEAMASDRPYKKARNPEEILLEIKQHTGTQFDPLVVDAFLEIVQEEGLSFIKNSAGENQESIPVLWPQRLVPIQR